VRQLAHQVGTNCRRLYVVCPDLLGRVVARRASAVSRLKREHHDGRVAAIKSAVAELIDEGAAVTRNAVMLKLQARGVKCVWLLKDIWTREFASKH